MEQNQKGVQLHTSMASVMRDSGDKRLRKIVNSQPDGDQLKKKAKTLRS